MQEARRHEAEKVNTTITTNCPASSRGFYFLLQETTR